MRWLFWAVGLVVAIGAFLSWDAYRVQNPDERAVRSEFEWFAGIDLPADVEVLAAKRSQPNFLLGDYQACMVVRAQAADLSGLLATVQRDTSGSSVLFSCPKGFALPADLAWSDLEFWTRGEVEPDESYLLYVNQDRTVLVLVSFMS